MAKRIQDGKLFYHVTALENLEGIFTHGLLSRPAALKKEILKADVADQEIIEKREALGILDYVPFHFFEKTAFTGAVYKNYKDTTFCVITILRDFAKNNDFKICTAHPLSKNPKPEVLTYNEGLESIDWKAMESRDYHDEKSKNACMAECLAISPVSPADFAIIFVPDENTYKYIDKLASNVIGNYLFDIMINPYFSKVRI